MIFLILFLGLFIEVSQGQIHASYVGCFSKKNVELNGLVPMNFNNCRESCIQREYAFVGYDNIKCFCVNNVPNPEKKVSEINCRRDNKGFVFLYYLTDILQRCEIKKLSLDWNNFEVPWGNRVEMWGSEMRIKMNPYSCDGGRINSKRLFNYTIITAEIKPNADAGIVGAFYLKSSKSAVNVRDDEIDIEFINSIPAKNRGTLWLNYFDLQSKKGGNLNKAITPQELKTLTGQKNFETYTDYHTYSMNWRINHITWYLRNKKLHISTTRIPKRLQYLKISLWSQGPKKPNIPEPWGGWCNPQFSYEREFSVRNVRFVECK